MRALEFKSKVKDNQIELPKNIQAALKKNQDKNIRVIVFIDDLEIEDDNAFKRITKKEFLKGYADSDSIYDTY